MTAYSPPNRVIVRQESVSQLVANVLRERIISGQLPNGSMLPRLDDLLQEFNVSKPSIREALRILETEGLVTVKRGKSGGAVVHAPSPHGAAYALAFVLESQHVTLVDLANALRSLEPLCASLCAANPTPELVGALEELLKETADHLDDEMQSVVVSRRFHEQIVAGCGNRTLITVIGALEALWSAHQLDWADRMKTRFDPTRRRSGLKEHRQILDAIRDGDPARAQRLMSRHMDKSYALPPRVSEESTIQRPADPRVSA